MIVVFRFFSFFYEQFSKLLDFFGIFFFNRGPDVILYRGVILQSYDGCSNWIRIFFSM